MHFFFIHNFFEFILELLSLVEQCNISLIYGYKC